jgi:hypothetical protein
MRELVARGQDAFPQVTATISSRDQVSTESPTVALRLLTRGSSRLMRGSRVRCAFVELVPGRIPDYLLDDAIGLLRADDRVFEAMLDGWRAQQLARGLTTAHIMTSSRMVTRFQEHTNEYPWTWMAHHFEEFLADLRTGEPPLKVSTLRSYTTAIRAFTRYVSDTRYGWVAFCERVFDDIPAQIVFDWNSPRHSTDDDVPTGRRALTRHEMQSLFDAADDFVDAEYARAVRDRRPLTVSLALGTSRRREPADLRTRLRARTRASRPAPGAHAALSAPLVCDAPDRSRLRPVLRPAAGRPPARLDDVAVHIGVVGLQAEDDPADDQPAPTTRQPGWWSRWLSNDASATTGACAR